MAGGYISMNTKLLQKIPIANLDYECNLNSFVDRILAITKDDDYMQNRIKQSKVREYEKQIDRLIYKLYDLTLDEIAIVEGRDT